MGTGLPTGGVATVEDSLVSGGFHYLAVRAWGFPPDLSVGTAVVPLGDWASLSTQLMVSTWLSTWLSTSGVPLVCFRSEQEKIVLPNTLGMYLCCSVGELN